MQKWSKRKTGVHTTYTFEYGPGLYLNLHQVGINLWDRTITRLTLGNRERDVSLKMFVCRTSLQKAKELMLTFAEKRWGPLDEIRELANPSYFNRWHLSGILDYLWLSNEPARNEYSVYYEKTNAQPCIVSGHKPIIGAWTQNFSTMREALDYVDAHVAQHYPIEVLAHRLDISKTRHESGVN